MSCILILKAAWIDIRLFFKYNHLRFKKILNDHKLRRRAKKSKRAGEVVHATYDDGDKHSEITAYVSSYLESAAEPNCYHLKMFLADFLLLAPEYKIHIYYHDLAKIKYICIDLENQQEITMTGAVSDGIINIVPNSQTYAPTTQIN